MAAAEELVATETSSDLRTTLESAFREAEAAQTAPEPPPEPAASAQHAPTDDRPRDERGRFVSGVSETTDSTTKADPAASEAGADAAAPKPETPAPAPETDAAPAPPVSWSAQAKAKWHELPPEIQAEVAKRERDVTKGFTKLDDERAFARSIQQVLSPVASVMQANGLPPTQYLQGLVQTDQFLRTASPDQVKQALMNFAAQRGIRFDADATQQPSEPNYTALQQQVAQLQSQLTAREQAARHAEESTIAADIEKFRNDPANVYFEQVKSAMSGLLMSGRAQSLKDAYDQAVWAVPETREALLAQQKAQEIARQRTEQAKAASAAKAKAVSVSGSPGIAVSASAAPAGSLREELERQFRASSGAV